VDIKLQNKMKKIFLIITVFIGATLFNSCNNEVEIPEVIENNIVLDVETRSAIRALVADLYGREDVSFSEIESAVFQKFGIDEDEVRMLRTRTSTADVSDAALSVADELNAIDALDFPTHTDYLLALEKVLKVNRNILTDVEYTSLLISLYITSDIIDEIDTHVSTSLRSGCTCSNCNPSWWQRNGQCVSGIISGAGLGALAGSLVKPVVGTIVGAIAGGFGGVAEYCF